MDLVRKKNLPGYREPKPVWGREISANFLEYEYGIKPLLKDIDSSIEILTRGDFDLPIRSQASDQIQSVNWVAGSFGSNPRYSYFDRTVVDGRFQIRLRATVRVTNPNLFLANQLGLIDLALPWKLVPFSFVVDWFVNVEQVISSMTDWYGVTLLNPHTTVFTKGSKLSRYWQNAVYTSGHVEGYTTFRDKECVTMDRTMGIPSPILNLKPFRGFSLERGAQAIALVISVLGSGSRFL
jgi:hypothetical protein